MEGERDGVGAGVPGRGRNWAGEGGRPIPTLGKFSRAA